MTNFSPDEWYFETKLDGLRTQVRFDGDRLSLLSRNYIAQEREFPELLMSLQSGLKKCAVFDGEIVCFDSDGRSSFQVIQQRMHLTATSELKKRMKEFPAYLYLFDILFWDKYDLTNLRLCDRRKILSSLPIFNSRIRLTPVLEDPLSENLERECKVGGEGIICKKKNSTYRPGRSSSWIKLKCTRRQEFVVGGYTHPQGARGGFGALLVGYYAADGKLHYCGKVGAGFDLRTLYFLTPRLKALKQSFSPFSGDNRLEGPGIYWIKPVLVAEVEFSEWTLGGYLRHPRYLGIRRDKQPRDVVRENAKAA